MCNYSVKKNFVLCDESGHTKFPFSYLAHVTLLTLAQSLFPEDCAAARTITLILAERA